MPKGRKGRPSNLGQLKRSGYEAVSVREEMRRNLMRKLKRGEQLFRGIIGYDETVIPQLENAILAGQGIYTVSIVIGGICIQVGYWFTEEGITILGWIIMIGGGLIAILGTWTALVGTKEEIELRE